MIEYFDYLVPTIVIVLGTFRYAKMRHLIADRGELYYAFRQAWWKELSDVGLSVLLFLFVATISWYKFDFSSFYILDKYFQDPMSLFDSGYYYDLKMSLKSSNQTDYEALMSLKSLFRALPTFILIGPTVLASFMPRLLSAGLYANGIFNGVAYYAYDELASYTTETVNGKATLTFKYHKQTFLGNDKEVDITIDEEELYEVENFLKHEIRHKSEFEVRFNEINEKNQPGYE